MTVEDPSVPGTGLQWLSALTVTTQTMIIGISLTQTMVLIPALQAEPEGSPLKIDLEQGSFLAMSFMAFALIGALACGFLGDLFGRRIVLLSTLVGFLISWIVVATAKVMWVMQIGRCLMGFVDGGAYGVTTAYLSEIADKNMRGPLVNLVNVGQALGMLILIVLGWLVSNDFRLLCWIIAGMIVISIILHMWLMPETPYYLVLTGKEKEARKVLQLLRGRHYDIESEMKEISDRWEKTSQQRKLAEAENRSKVIEVVKTLKQPKFLRPFAVGLPAAVFPPMSGYNSFFMYLVNIFQESGTAVNVFLASGVVAFTRLIACVISSYALKHSLQRRLFIICGLLGSLSLVLLGAASMARPKVLEQDVENTTDHHPLGSAAMNQNDEQDNITFDKIWMTVLNYAPIATLMSAYVCFSLGIDSVTRVILGEIFPTEIRSLANGICVVFSCCGIFLASFLFPRLLNWVGFGATFLCFGAISLVGSIYIFVVTPESKGQSLTSVEEHFDSGKEKNKSFELENK